MNRFAVAWVAALALSTVSAAPAQTTSGQMGGHQGHMHPTQPFPPNPPIGHQPPIGRRTPQPVQHAHVHNNGRGSGAYGAYTMVPPDYVQNALAMPVRAPKPRPTASSMYETFYTVKNHR